MSLSTRDQRSSSHLPLHISCLFLISQEKTNVFSMTVMSTLRLSPLILGRRLVDRYAALCYDDVMQIYQFCIQVSSSSRSTLVESDLKSFWISALRDGLSSFLSSIRQLRGHLEIFFVIVERLDILFDRTVLSSASLYHVTLRHTTIRYVMVTRNVIQRNRVDVLRSRVMSLSNLRLLFR